MNSSEIASWYRGRTVVVTGAYGYLGSSLCGLLTAAGAKVRRGTRGRPGAENAADTWIGDLADPAYCAQLVADADAIFHMAGQTSVPESHKAPLDDLHINVQHTLTLLEACRQTGKAPAFVYAGTATEIGLTTSVPLPPGVIDRPCTVYDVHKLAAEQLVDAYRFNGWVTGLTLRIANVFGPGAKKSASERGVINKLIARAMSGLDFTYYGDGQLVRDYVYVADLLDVFFRAGALAPSAKERSYVIASGVGHTLRETFELIADVVAAGGYPHVKVGSAPWPQGLHPIDRRSYVSNIEPLTAFCGWKPTTSLAEGIRLTMETFRNNTKE